MCVCGGGGYRERHLVFLISMHSFNLYFWTIILSLSIHNVILSSSSNTATGTATTTAPRRVRSLISYDVLTVVLQICQNMLCLSQPYYYRGPVVHVEPVVVPR